MMSLPRNRRFFPRPQTIAGLLALSGIVVSSLGVVVVPRGPANTGGAFPCQGGACGCATAEQCWRSCCCTTLAERLRWAERNGVSPPEFVVRQVADESTPSNPAPRTCCKGSHDKPAPEACCTDSPPPAPATVALLEQVNRCRGLAGNMAVVRAAICEPLADLPVTDLPPGDWLGSVDERFDVPHLPPPTPPPRLAA